MAASIAPECNEVKEFVFLIKKKKKKASFEIADSITENTTHAS